MTLSIFVSYIDEMTGEEKRVDLGPGGDLAGVEVARSEFWGLPIMEELGLQIIPSLKYQDIFASGEELDTLEHEANIILENISVIVANQKMNALDYFTHRVTNILKAVAKAREVNGEVNIG